MLRSIGFVTGLALLMVACGGGGGGGGTVGGGTGGQVSAPQNLQYLLVPGTTFIGEVGVPYGPFPPYVSGTVTGYSVSPALPAGLTLDPTSGVFSGTPLAASPETTYTVTASNAGGSVTAVLTFPVLVPPTIAYASPVTASVGVALTPLVPTLGGDINSLFIQPALPDGLTFDPATGIVSGTPSRARVAVTYAVTARNAGAYTTADLLLAVGPPPTGTAVTGVFRGETVMGLGYVSGTHRGITDTSGAFTYEVGQGITFTVGAVGIGALPVAKELVTPVDLVAKGTGASTHVLNVVRFLMMLDQDGNANNGIQISAAVTTAAASWAPVDFDTADLPTTLSPLIQQARAADGVSHVLPDAATAQAHLRTGFYCARSGNYYGTFGEQQLAGDRRGDFTTSVFPDGSMHSIAHAHAGETLVGFDVQTKDAVSPLLDGSFAQSDDSLGVSLKGSFADPTVLSGTILIPVDGSFQAIADASIAVNYKFFGYFTRTDSSYSTPVFFGMDDSRQVLGLVFGHPSGIALTLSGTVSGNTFTGTASYFYMGNLRPTTFSSPVSGTYSNTASGVTFDGQFSTTHGVVTFSTVGCRN